MQCSWIDNVTAEKLRSVKELKLVNVVKQNEKRWKDNGEVSTDDGHIMYYSGSSGKHEYGVGFIVNSTVTNSVI